MSDTEAFELEENTEKEEKVWYIHELDKYGKRIRVVAAFYVHKMAEKTLRALNKDKGNEENDKAIDEFLDKYDDLIRRLQDY